MKLIIDGKRSIYHGYSQTFSADFENLTIPFLTINCQQIRWLLIKSNWGHWRNLTKLLTIRHGVGFQEQWILSWLYVFLWCFLKIAQFAGQTWEPFFGVRLFSLTSSALDHSATAPPNSWLYVCSVSLFHGHTLEI